MGMTPLFLSVRSDQIRAMQIRFSGRFLKIPWEILRDKTEPDATKLQLTGIAKISWAVHAQKGLRPPHAPSGIPGGFSVAFYDAKMRFFEAQNVACCRWGVMHDPGATPHWLGCPGRRYDGSVQGGYTGSSLLADRRDLLFFAQNLHKIFFLLFFFR